VGSFDEGLLPHSEESDWCARARSAGWQIHHLTSVSLEVIGLNDGRRGDGAAADEALAAGQFSPSRYRYFRSQNTRTVVLAADAVDGVKRLVRTARSVIEQGSKRMRG
jgi:hypothetical protein